MRSCPTSLRTAASSVVLALALLSVGCEANYASLRFRPVDTTSQMVVEDVRITVSTGGSQPAERARTNEHGQAEIGNLRAGDTLTFSKDGYQSAVVVLDYSSYFQRSPSSDSTPVRLELQNLDTVPVPLHRSGAVVRP